MSLKTLVGSGSGSGSRMKIKKFGSGSGFGSFRIRNPDIGENVNMRGKKQKP